MQPMRGSRLDHLEELAEELIKENPEESVVRAHMKAAGLKYSADACDRLEQVLFSLDQARATQASSPRALTHAHSPKKAKSHAKDL